MTVSGTFRVDIRPYSGYDDPGLPIGAWIAQGGIAGDASGGQVIMDFLFKQGDDNLVTELYSLDQISVDTTSATTIEIVMETLNMDSLAFNRLASTQKWIMQARNVGSTLGGNVVPLDEIQALPIWLGSPNATEGDSGLRYRFLNIDLILFAVLLQGYIWGPRSVLAEGGPRRPVGGLFSP